MLWSTELEKCCFFFLFLFLEWDWHDPQLEQFWVKGQPETTWEWSDLYTASSIVFLSGNKQRTQKTLTPPYHIFLHFQAQCSISVQLKAKLHLPFLGLDSVLFQSTFKKRRRGENLRRRLLKGWVWHIFWPEVFLYCSRCIIDGGSLHFRETGL